jgi:hypothetical protein
MADVQSIGKNERNKDQGFSFRGIDTVVNAVGPALREHGVLVIPRPVSIQFHDYETKRGTAMRNCVVEMAYTIKGPAGDTIDGGGAYGEASDAGDKSVSKAQSVAYRVFLLEALAIPTDEPDPDLETHERVASPAPSLSVGQAGFAEAANRLDNPQRAALRALLIEKGLPTKAADMSEAEAAQALLVLNGMLSGDGQ